MRNLKFHYLAAKNFLCFGPEGIQIHFDDYGQVVQVVGENLDVTGSDEHIPSNGAGKSALHDAFSFALYGKTVKKPTKLKGGKVVNAKIGKKCEVEIQFDDHRIVRSLEPNKLQVWRSKDRLWDASTLLDRGGTPETQKYIDGIIGLSHRAFCNVVVFDDRDAYAFLESDAATKREIIENFIGLDKFRNFFDTSKDLIKENKKLISEKSQEYQRLINEVSACDIRCAKVVEQESVWKQKKQLQLQALVTQVKTKQTELEGTDDTKALATYEAAQEQLGFIKVDILELESKKVKLEESILTAEASVQDAADKKNDLMLKVQERMLNLKSLQNKLKSSGELIEALSNLTHDAKCPVCYGSIDQNNYINVLRREQNVSEQALDASQKETALLTRDQGDLSVMTANLKKATEGIVGARSRVQQFNEEIRGKTSKVEQLRSLSKPQLNSAQQALEAEITQLKQQYTAAKAELSESPYAEILVAAVQEKEQKTKELELKSVEVKQAEADGPYFDLASQAFGDHGIRRSVVDGIIPALNARVGYWLQHLIKNKIELTFDSELTETIKRNGVEAFYHAMSNGEIRRINLAVSQAFSYIMMFTSGRCPSVVFLDEITGGGIDRAGTNGVYNMIFELAKERQVFITTHNSDLLKMLEGCETILLRKSNDITTLIR